MEAGLHTRIALRDCARDEIAQRQPHGSRPRSVDAGTIDHKNAQPMYIITLAHVV